MRRFLFLFALCAVAAAKDTPKQVIDWPSPDRTLVRFSLAKLTQTASSYGREKFYVVEIFVENRTSETIPRASFSAFFFDKNNVRTADSSLTIENARPGESIRIPLSISAASAPNRMEVAPLNVPPSWGLSAARKISVTVYSVPAGAALKVDGVPAGVTPIAISVTPGGHMLEFTKEGFSPGNFPLHIAPDQLPGGQVSFELGTSAHDTVELRDGNVLTCDVESVGPKEVVILIDGARQTLDRNRIKRILFTVRN